MGGRDTTGLQRGVPPGSEHAAGERLAQARKRLAIELEEAGEQIREDPQALAEALFVEFGKLALKLARAATKEGGRVDRELSGVSREVRQLLEKLEEYREKRGQGQEAEQWLADVEARMEVVATRLEAGLRPAVEVVA